MDSKTMKLDFTECIETPQGFVIVHNETKWQYIKPQPTEEQAWVEFEQTTKDLGAAVAALLRISPNILISFDARNYQIRPKPRKEKRSAS